MIIYFKSLTIKQLNNLIEFSIIVNIVFKLLNIHILIFINCNYMFNNLIV